MKVGVNLLALKPGRQGGVEHYARHLTAALARDPRQELVLLLPEELSNAFEETAPDLRVHSYQGPYSDRAINEAVLAEGIDLLWYPWVSGCPLRAAVPAVVTVADLQHEHMPENFTAGDRRERDQAYFMAAHMAHALITFSRHTCDDLVRTYGVTPERVHPIPLAAGQDWDSPEPADRLLAELREAHGAGFLLYPANTWPHKDHLLLLRAIRRLADEGEPVRLVLTGSWDEGGGAVGQAVGDLRLEDQVANLGIVPPETLQALYRLCGVLVFPSRFEGFGMPVLDAMGAGVPVLCSDATSLPEVGGDAVLYFKAGDLDALVAGLRRILTDEPLRQSLVARGRELYREFSWKRTAAATARVFESALAGPPPQSPAARALNTLADRIDQADAEAEARLTKLVQADAEAEARLTKLVQADAEAQEYLALVQDHRAVIARIVAEVHSIRAFLETARPREFLGLATPFEVVRVRRVVKHTVQRLRDLVTG